ncbi:hypothetical protein BDW59DRAFT_49912 [Aspergillus cavernicola]|uniref:Uncharacterized protein n=1 Tax=Aspergillus cavernicola TaxID=176166 RepID=A0ABR4IL44_9EURO
MWLFRGAQSAVFYYATCTPCADSINRRKRKKEAVRSRSQREKQYSDAIITDQPRPFPQPAPFSTNPGWTEELVLGPGPPKKRGGHRTATHYRMESWDTGAFSTASAQDIDPSLSSSQRKDKPGTKHLGDRWNRMIRYQREDEPLWGEEIEVKGSSVGLSGRGKVDAQTPSKYYIARVPPVNDFHSPIVSGPKSRAETRWMLQPPPSAKVMAGKEQSRAPARPVDYSGLRVDTDKSTSRCSERTHTLPPLATEITEKYPVSSPSRHCPSPKTPGSGTQDPVIPRQPSPTLFTYGKDEHNFVMSPSNHSASDSCSTLSSPGESDLESLRDSLQPPDTPISRPISKASNHPRNSRPSISRALTTVYQDKKKVHMLHFEIQDLNDLEVGQVHRVRPWRWSMDI